MRDTCPSATVETHLSFSIGISLLSLAHMFGGLQVHLEAEDLSAQVSTPLGHEIYDVLCVYSVMIGLAKGTKPSHSLATAGSNDIEDIFGVARSMWNMLARLATLLADVRKMNPVAKLIGIDGTEQECRQLLEESAMVQAKIERSSRSRRIQLGSKVSNMSDHFLLHGLMLHQTIHHTILILAHIEVLQTPRSDPRVQASCSAILETLLQIDRRERRVGVALPLTVRHIAIRFYLHRANTPSQISSCYTNDPLQRMQLIELTQIIRAIRELDAPNPTISDLAFSLAAGAPDSERAMPWREAMQVAHLSMLL